MRLTLASLFALATLAVAAPTADEHTKHHGKHHSSHHKHPAGKGKAFDHILQVWFENQVHILREAVMSGVENNLSPF